MSKLTAKHNKLLNSKINDFHSDLHKLLVKHGLQDFQINKLYFKLKADHDDCRDDCGDGEEAQMVCAHGVCSCECVPK